MSRKTTTTRKIGLHIDYLKDDMQKLGIELGGDYPYRFNSNRIDALHTAIGTLIRLKSEIGKEGMSKLDSER